MQGVFDNLREKVKTAFGLNYTEKIPLLLLKSRNVAIEN